VHQILRSGGFLVAALVGLAIQPASANITYNPGFELGSAGWTTNPNLTDSWIITDTEGVFGGSPSNGAFPHSGSWWAQDGCPTAGHTPDDSCVSPYPDPNGNWMYQDLSTVVGDNYSLTFWFVSDGSPMEMEALFGSTVAIDITSIPPASDDVYQQYSNTVTLTATSSTTMLQFLDYQGPGWASLDDIDVEDLGGAAVPEPATFALIGLGLTLVGLKSFLPKPDRLRRRLD
jgi:hypothetical protein